MNREEKSVAIEEIAAQIEASEAIFAIDYRGISVTQAAELRSKLRESDASFRVVKNRLTKLAAAKAGEERLETVLQGPTALTFVRGDTAAAAKAITTFNKEHEVLTFKGGFMAETVLDEDSFKAISRLPGREVLNGQLAGVVASPLTGLVRGLGSMIQGLALQLGQIAEKGLVSGEAPVADAAPEAPAAEESPAAEAEQAAPEAEQTSTEEEAPSEEPASEEPASEEPAAEAEQAPEAEAAEAPTAEAEDNTSEQDSNEEEG